MKRREFISLLGGAVAAWPLAARAQQPPKLPTIGFLGESTPVAQSERTAAFVQRLRELGWTEGRTVAIEYRWAEGRSERFAEIATELVRLKVDVIVTSSTPAVIAAKQATSVIPIVFAIAADPIGTGLVASLARPGGNVTGLSIQSTDIAAKRLALLREIIPSLRRLAIMANLGNPQHDGAGRAPADDLQRSGVRRDFCRQPPRGSDAISPVLQSGEQRRPVFTCQAQTGRPMPQQLLSRFSGGSSLGFGATDSFESSRASRPRNIAKQRPPRV